MGIYKNISGTITKVDETGIGLISPSTSVGAHNKDVFFNKEALGECVVWSQIAVGLRVEMPVVFSKNGGLYAQEVKLHSVSTGSTEKWIEDIVDKIGIAQYSRLQDYFYTSRYQKVIQDLKKKHWQDTRNLCVFFILVILMLFYLNFTNSYLSPLEGRPEKTDYSPYGGWVYE